MANNFEDEIQIPVDWIEEPPLEQWPENGCDACGLPWHAMTIHHFRSPPDTWKHLYGRSGHVAVCPKCKKQIAVRVTFMN